MKISPLLDLYSNNESEAKQIFGMTIACSEGIASNKKSPFIMDLSAIPKLLVAGKGANALLTEFIAVTEELFTCSFAENGAYISQIMADQYLLVGDPTGQDFGPIFNRLRHNDPEVLVLPYESAEILIYDPEIWKNLSGLVTFDTKLLSQTALSSVRIATVDVYALLSRAPSQHLRITCSPADAHFLTKTISECLGETNDVLVGFDSNIKL